MALDTSIPLQIRPPQIESPVNALAHVLQIRGAQQDQAMNALRFDEARRNIEDQNALRASLSEPGADPYAALLKRGRVKEATDFRKATADTEKTAAETKAKQLEAAHKRLDLMGQGLGWLRQNPTLQNAQAIVQHLTDSGVMPPEKAQEAMAKFQADPTPQGIAAFAQMGFQAALSAKEQLPTFQTRSTGGTTDTLAIDPVTGQVRVANSVRNTQSPDSAASVAATIRGQNLTDARAREANADQKTAARTQVVETPDGVMLIDKGTGLARPAATMSGKPIPGKPSAGMEKEMTGIRQQNAVIDGAIAAVEKTPGAFSFTRGAATMTGPMTESVAGRFDSDEERQARSYVFNNVSKIINERAGAAQSVQELARLRAFLPAETDNAAQIKSKLKAFKTYLGDLEAGTKGQTVPKTANAFSDAEKERRYQEWKALQGRK